MCRAAIVRSRVPLSFDSKRVKGHVTESLCSPNISVLLSPLQIFLCRLFPPPPLRSGLQHLLVFSFPLCCSYPPLLFLHTRTRERARTHADTRADTHTHTEENLYVSDIQQGKDKGTELITHHLLLLRRTDGSRRYVNGKGQ